MHLPKYTARVSIVLASLALISNVAYQQFFKRDVQDIDEENSRAISGVLIDPEKDKKNYEPVASLLCEHFYQTACTPKEIIHDPTGSVQPDIKGEVEALRLYETILHEHPDWSNDQIDEELVQRIYTPKRKLMLLETYGWIKKRMVHLIETQPKQVFSKDTKKVLIARINNIVLELPPPVSLYANEPDLFTKNDVYYEGFPDGKRVIRVGGAYLLSAKSWFNRVFTIAHEMSHAIDPCEISGEKILVSGYEKLINCFYEENILSLTQIKEGCNKSNFIGELFSDWMATQITVQALQMYLPKFKNQQELTNSVVNSVKDLCYQDESQLSHSGSHPEPRTRIEKIFSKNIEVQKILGCKKKIEKIDYCTFEGKTNER